MLTILLAIALATPVVVVKPSPTATPAKASTKYCTPKAPVKDAAATAWQIANCRKKGK